MKQNYLITLTILLLISISCKKDENEPLGFDPSKCNTYIFQSNYLPKCKLIIQLNTERMIDSISYYYASMNNKPTSTQKFYYSGSNKIDSSIINGYIFHNDLQNITETYDYNANGLIKTIFRKVTTTGYFGTTERKDTIGFDRDYRDRIHKITTIKSSGTGKSISSIEYMYNENDNLVKSIYSTPTDTIVFPNNYEKNFLGHDTKINPLYELSIECNYPISVTGYRFLAIEYSLSKNNLTEMITHATPEPQEINQSYSYNHYSYPTKISSTQDIYNLDIFYTNQ